MFDRLEQRINRLRGKQATPENTDASPGEVLLEKVKQKRDSFLGHQIYSGGGLIAQLGLTGRLRDLTDAIVDGFYLTRIRYGHDQDPSHGKTYPSSEEDNQVMALELDAVKQNNARVVGIVEDMGQVLGSLDKAGDVKAQLSHGLQRGIALFGDGFDLTTKKREVLNHALREWMGKLADNEDFRTLKFHYHDLQQKPI